MASTQMGVNHADLNIAQFMPGNSSNSHAVRKTILESNGALQSDKDFLNKTDEGELEMLEERKHKRGLSNIEAQNKVLDMDKLSQTSMIQQAHNDPISLKIHFLSLSLGSHVRREP